jgi:hypothetical protein
MRRGWQTHAILNPECGLGETPQIVKRWNRKSMMTISVKETRCIHSFYIIFFSIVESKEKVYLQVCDTAAPLAR